MVNMTLWHLTETSGNFHGFLSACANLHITLQRNTLWLLYYMTEMHLIFQIVLVHLSNVNHQRLKYLLSVKSCYDAIDFSGGWVKVTDLITDVLSARKGIQRGERFWSYLSALLNLHPSFKIFFKCSCSCLQFCKSLNIFIEDKSAIGIEISEITRFMPSTGRLNLTAKWHVTTTVKRPSSKTCGLKVESQWA